jgi:hypothetical protein
MFKHSTMKCIPLHQKFFRERYNLTNHLILFMPTRDQPADGHDAEGDGVNLSTSPRSTIFCEINKIATDFV